MLTRLSLCNFRCFSKLDINNLRRINIVTGPNGSGKTALLEGIYLGNKAVPFAVGRINAARALPNIAVPFIPGLLGLGLSAFSPAFTSESFRAQWDNLFHNYDTKENVKIEYDIEDSVLKTVKTYSLSLHYGDVGPGQTQLIQPPAINTGLATTITPFVLSRQKGGGEPQNITVNASGNQITHEAISDPLGLDSAYFTASGPYAETDNVTWFSDLSKAGEEQDLINSLRGIFPNIHDLNVLSFNGTSGIYATTESGKKIPLSLVSAGIHKLLSIMLGLWSYQNSVIVIDEIENGLFYERYADMWRLMYDIATRRNNQVFVSTHSLECLQSMAGILSDHDEDFCLLRPSRFSPTDSRDIEYVSGASLLAALAQSGEVRG